MQIICNNFSQEPQLLPSKLVEFFFQVSQHRKDMDVVEWAQKRVTKIIRRMEPFSYEEKLRQLLFGVEKKWFCGDPIVAFENLKGSCKKKGREHFSRVCTIGQGVTVSNKKREDLDQIQGRYFYNEGGQTLPQVMDALSLETFMVRLDRALRILIYLKMSLLTAGGLQI